MKEFFSRFLPRSNFAYSIFGFLIHERIFAIEGEIFLLNLLCGIFTGFFFLLKKWKIFWFSLGMILYFGYTLIIKYYPSDKPVVYSIIQFEEIKKKKIPIFINLIKEKKKNYWVSEISVNGENKEAIVNLKDWRNDFIPVFACGSDLIKIKTIQKSFGDFFNFLKNYGDYYIQFPQKKCDIISEKPDLKRRIKNYIETLLIRGGLTDYSLEISLGLIFGDSSYLDKEFKMKAKEGGILHLFAASGLHIGIFTGFIYLILSRISFINYYALKIIPTIAALFYLILLDFPVSLSRAFCFISILMLASIFFRKTHSTDVILFSSFFIFLLDRDGYLGLSFCLSFSAVMGIFYFKNALDDILFKGFRNIFTDNLTISLSATIGTFPVLMFYFHSFSFGSILVNYILVPMTSFILPVLYIALMIEFLQIPYMDQLIWCYSDLLIRIQAWLSDFLSKYAGFYKEFDMFGLYHIYLFLSYILVFVFCVIVIEKIRRKDIQINRNFQNLKYFLLSAFFAVVTICFFLAGYFIYPSNKRSTQIIGAATDYFLVKNADQVYLGGNCKYSLYKLKNIFQNSICNQKNLKLYIENENCISLVKSCSDTYSIKSLEYADESVLSWEKSMPGTKFRKVQLLKKIQLSDTSLILFFKPDKDGLNFLLNETKDGFGKIVVLFPYKSKDNIDDWNKNQKLLGINENWKFISPAEL